MNHARFAWLAILAVGNVAGLGVTGEYFLVKNVAEFDAAVKVLKPGDQIALADGEWRDADLVFQATGSDSEEWWRTQITLSPETPGKVVLTGKSRLRIAGKYLVVHDLLWRDSTADEAVISFRVDSKQQAENCRLVECAIIGDAADKERKWVSLYGKHNTVEHCRFEGKQSPGTTLVVWLGDEPNGHAVYKTFFGPRPRLGKNGGETIRIGDSKTSLRDSNTHITANYFYHCDGEAEIISNKSCGNVYEENVFVGCGGALTLRHGNRCEVRKNRFFGDGRKGTGGVRMIGEDHVVELNEFTDLEGTGSRAALSLMNGVPNSPLNGYFQVARAQIRFNDFANCRETVLIGTRDDDVDEQTLPPRECRFERNFVVSKRQSAFQIQTSPIAMTIVDNYIDGELGLASRDGWTEFDSERPRGRTSRVDPRHMQYGPNWLRPGDEYLPEVLKPKQK